MTSYTNFINRGTIGIEQGSNTVNGVGTTFVTDGVLGGVLFVNGASHPIMEVLSETQLRIGSIWPSIGYESNIPYFIGLMDSQAATGIWANQQLADTIRRLTEVKVLTDPFEQILDLAQPGKLLGIATADPLQFEMVDAQMTLAVDATVNDLPGRAIYDAEAEGFRVLVRNVSNNRSAIYTRVGAAGNWSMPVYVTGPMLDLSVGTVETIPYGEAPTVTIVPTPTGQEASFEFPAGMSIEIGSTTTVAAGQPARVIQTPITGGVKLDFEIPVGYNGGLDLVTPYWSDRLLNETTADQARAAIEAVKGPASAVSGRIALFSGTTGKELVQAGLSISDLEPARTLVTQAEAEAGTATTTRGWTAQRVKQAATKAAEPVATAAVNALPALRYDAAQSLTPLQKSWARANADVGLLAGFRNKIINGDFMVCQEGANNPDLWYVDRVGSTCSTATVQLLPGVIPGSLARHYVKLNFTSVAGANNYAKFDHKIENVRTLAGKRATLSFYAKANASGKAIAVELFQHFGTGGSASGLVLGLGGNTHTLTTSWQRIDTVIDIPPINGKVPGTNDNDYLAVSLWVDAGTTIRAGRVPAMIQQSGQIDLTSVTLVEGDVTAESHLFEPRHEQQEIALCQRYYFRIPGSISMMAGSGTAWGRGALVFHPTQMRVAPTASVQSQSHPFVGAPASTQWHTAISLNAGNNSDLSSITDLRLDSRL